MININQYLKGYLLDYYFIFFKIICTTLHNYLMKICMKFKIYEIKTIIKCYSKKTNLKHQTLLETHSFMQ